MTASVVDMFFVIGGFRSGTTAITRMLNEASNAHVTIEQAPKLLEESRELFEGRLKNPGKVLLDARQEYIDKSKKTGCIYGDKNPAYMSFIPYLESVGEFKIIFLYRDGRDVVRSMMDWHRFKSPVIYARSEDGEPKESSETVSGWDYMLLRPAVDDEIGVVWKSLSRFEKCSWYWSKFNENALKYLENLPQERWITLDVSDRDNQLENIERAFDFLDLRGFVREKIENIINGRVNSLAHRMGLEDHFPRWNEWEEDLTVKFDKHAEGMMRHFGYYK